MKKEHIFSFKQKSQDFIVEEKLPFELTGKGDAFFVYFEKRNNTTMEVVDHLCKSLKVSRMTLGIAGLKDKKAITRQWISIYKSALKKMGGERVFLDALAEMVTVLKTARHTDPLNVRTPISNVFHIRLRASKKLGLEEKARAQRNVEELFADGFPNIFGEQRFGIQGRNRKQGKDILMGESDLKEKKEIVFKLQSFASKMFNEYVDLRIKQGLEVWDGDIVSVTGDACIKSYAVYNKQLGLVQPFTNPAGGDTFWRFPEQGESKSTWDAQKMIITGPVIGFNALLCQPNSLAGKYEQGFLKQKHLNEKALQAFRDHRVYGLRRELWVRPGDYSVRYQEDDLLIRFSLPSGSYASVLIDMMMERLALDSV